MSAPGYSKPSHQYGQSLPGDELDLSAPQVGEALEWREPGMTGPENLTETPEAVLRRYAGVLTGLEQLHLPVPRAGEDMGDVCAEDGQVWPCRTVRIMHPEWGA